MDPSIINKAINWIVDLLYVEVETHLCTTVSKSQNIFTKKVKKAKQYLEKAKNLKRAWQRKKIQTFAFLHIINNLLLDAIILV